MILRSPSTNVLIIDSKVIKVIVLLARLNLSVTLLNEFIPNDFADIVR